MLTSAMAETAANTAAQAPVQLEYHVIISLFITATFLFAGLACLLTGKAYGAGKLGLRYTDESIARFARPYGGSQLTVGIGLLLLDLHKLFQIGPEAFMILGLVLGVLGAIAMVLCFWKLLEKK